ncbi:TRAP transporter small permease [Virgibacillus doumboii]|uniref:TRAP transporter small permease n=1 Tax=Virgibacillus doumboii TaxID=2697503 RepID=UPI0013DE8775|nr:TRAP transporter small permease [Virgibacillus doumboii]
MKLLKFLNEHIEEVILVILLSIMVVSTFSQIIMRQIFNNSLSWSSELSRYAFIWLVFIGVSYATKKQKHLNIDVMVGNLSGRKKDLISIISNTIFIVFCIIVIFYGGNSTIEIFNSSQVSPAMQIPQGIVYLALPVGFGLTLIRLVQNIISDFNSLQESKLN